PPSVHDTEAEHLREGFSLFDGLGLVDGLGFRALVRSRKGVFMPCSEPQSVNLSRTFATKC
ncbi:MAG TPA: hypothetical protein PK493_22325, partial [Pseudomonadota bacterium]|nr:hypothetical protein [Pseudomonadota bacterium]